MWIPRSEHDEYVRNLATVVAGLEGVSVQLRTVQSEKAELCATHDQLVRDLATAKASLGWMYVQLNTVQAEKSALLSAVTKTPIMTPTIRPTDSSPLAPAIAERPAEMDGFLGKLASMFEDPGDEAAAKMGLGHDAHGTLIYR